MKKVAILAVLVGLVGWADTVDFRRYVVVVTSSGDETVGRQETEELEARALQALRGVSYDRDWTVAAFLGAHPKQAGKLERMTLQHRKSNTRFRSDGVMSVSYEFPITGNVMEQLLPETAARKLLGKVACPCCGQEWPEDREAPADVELVPLEDENAPVYSGILFDCRGMDFEYALLPRVVTEAGDEVYGPDFTDDEYLAEQGIVGYYQDETEAMVSERTGSNSLTVRVLAVDGSNRCDFIVSDYDAARVHGTMANLELMAQCRVGFLVD